MRTISSRAILSAVQEVMAVAVDRRCPALPQAPLPDKIACSDQRDGGFLAGRETTVIFARPF